MRGAFEAVVTTDQLELHGAVFHPDGDPVGAVVLVHGMGGAKLEHPYQWWLAEAVTTRGWMLVVGDNRGAATVKEFADAVSGRSRFYGCARELIVESPLDVAAWCGVVPSSVSSIVLAGHSLGAPKVVLSHQADPRVTALALLAPADMVALAQRSRDLDRFLVVAEAEISAGRGERLLDDFLYGNWTPMSAQTLWERRGRGAPGDVIDASRDDAVTALADVAVPIAAIIGGADTCMDVDPSIGLARLAAQATSAPSFTSIVIPDVDHHYTGARDALCDAFTTFLDALGTSDGR